jgi:hypothetical protein
MPLILAGEGGRGLMALTLLWLSLSLSLSLSHALLYPWLTPGTQDARLHDSLRKETKRQQPQDSRYHSQGQGQGHKQQQQQHQQEVEFGPDGQPVHGGVGEGSDENFLPKRPDVIDVS